VNPLASHWLRVSVLLLIAMPIVAFALALTSEVDIRLALVFTLYAWLVVCVILAAVATVGLIVRLVGKGMRALRR
jgi:hypothetical protein